MIRPDFLASPQFAPGYPDAMPALGLGYFCRKHKYSNFGNLFKGFCLKHLMFGFVSCFNIRLCHELSVTSYEEFSI